MPPNTRSRTKIIAARATIAMTPKKLPNVDNASCAASITSYAVDSESTASRPCISVRITDPNAITIPTNTNAIASGPSFSTACSIPIFLFVHLLCVWFVLVEVFILVM